MFFDDTPTETAPIGSGPIGPIPSYDDLSD